MALTLEQRTEIIGMITHAQEEVHTRAMGEGTTGLSEIRMATDLFYLKQTKMNEEFEVKLGQLSTGIEAKFTELRSELGVQFASMQSSSVEVREMMDTLETRKTAMATEIAATFASMDEKASEMETLIGQSTEVMKKTRPGRRCAQDGEREVARARRELQPDLGEGDGVRRARESSATASGQGAIIGCPWASRQMHQHAASTRATSVRYVVKCCLAANKLQAMHKYA